MKPGSLQRCQVATPAPVIEWMWALALGRRRAFRRVADFGAGDARFSRYGTYTQYLGYEVDESRIVTKSLPRKAKVLRADAFDNLDENFCLSIGNPPYVKSSELDPTWREDVCARLEAATGAAISRNANLFVYFLFLSLLRTKDAGLVVQLVPYEWVSRPSAAALREFIRDNGWSVDVYRFQDEVFDRVLTTASVSVIDKSTDKSVWRYFNLDKDFKASRQSVPSGSRRKILPYSERADQSHCLRGLSPGGQDLFVLTEHERVFHRLRVGTDVYPAVTTLRHVPESLHHLNKKNFSAYFVSQGARCWLLKSDVAEPSQRVLDYISTITPEQWNRYSTCTNRPLWWRFANHPAAPILLASGFRNRSPKVLSNTVGAIACGSVYAVFTKNKKVVPSLAKGLRAFDFSSRVVAHANGLKKLEVNQVNAALQTLI